jgi:hypothetical protein
MVDLIDIPKGDMSGNIDSDSFAVVFRAENNNSTAYRVDLHLVASNGVGDIVAEDVREDVVFDTGEVKRFLAMGEYAHNESPGTNVTVCVKSKNEISLDPPQF